MLDASDGAGFIASALVLITFAMRDMRTLRCTAIASNVAFIIYGISNMLIPVLALHILLLPLNIHQLRSACRSARRGRVAHGGADRATRMAIDALYLAKTAREKRQGNRPPQDHSTRLCAQ